MSPAYFLLATVGKNENQNITRRAYGEYRILGYASITLDLISAVTVNFYIVQNVATCIFKLVPATILRAHIGSI